MPMNLLEKWNESAVTRDPVTLRRVIRLTSFGQYNQTPTYHTNTAFSEDGRYVVFASARGEMSYIVRGDAETGELTALYAADGTGSRDYMHASDWAEVGNGRGVCGNRLALASRSGWAVFTHNTALLAVNIYSAELRTLIGDIGDGWIFGAPSISCDEINVAVPISTAHPQLAAGKPLTRGYTSYDDHEMRLVCVPLKGGESRELYRAKPCQCSHAAFCPSDPDLLYFDRNVPPAYWYFNDGSTPRIWLYRISTGETWPLRKKYPGIFQVHSAWTWKGDAIAYHGFLGREGYPSGIYIGITSRDSTPIRDYVFKDITNYGHINPDPVKPALILDGDVMPGCLSWLYYDEELPRIEIICRHDTEWETIPGQYSHPHPQSDPTGRYISFNRAKNGRSDIYIVSV